MDGQPGDKSPGYYRVSLRDEVKTGFQMSKLQGPSGRRPPRDTDTNRPGLLTKEKNRRAPRRVHRKRRRQARTETMTPTKSAKSPAGMACRVLVMPTEPK